jgi:hypothetical protein
VRLDLVTTEPDPPNDLEATAREIAQLKEALATRTVIGQALGILMERFDISGDQAFTYLARASQVRNQKLREIAGHLVRSRRMPELPHRADLDPDSCEGDTEPPTA